jgi:hypothetical protein
MATANSKEYAAGPRYPWLTGDEVTGGWRKLHNEELHGLYSSPSIVRVIKARRIRWAGHVARMGGGEGCIQHFGWEA